MDINHTIYIKSGRQEISPTRSSPKTAELLDCGPILMAVIVRNMTIAARGHVHGLQL